MGGAGARSVLRWQLGMDREGRRGPSDPERAPRHAEFALVEGRARVDLEFVGVLPERGLEIEYDAAARCQQLALHLDAPGRRVADRSRDEAHCGMVLGVEEVDRAQVLV